MRPRIQLLLKISFILIPIIVFLIYGFNKAGDFLNGPRIIIETPQNGLTVSNSSLEIKGNAQNVSMIYLDGRQIFTNKNGDFKENLLLAKGYNIIELSAVDQFNRKIKSQKEIVLK